MEQQSVTCLVSLLLFIMFIPSPAQALCNDSESCGILGGFLLSMLTIPVSLFLLFLAIWPSTRTLLKGFAILPGMMAVLTGYLMVIEAQRFDMAYIPFIHAGLMGLMIFLARLGSSEASKDTRL
jgi:hypothetical protein